jgi:hypothetical protein
MLDIWGAMGVAPDRIPGASATTCQLCQALACISKGPDSSLLRSLQSVLVCFPLALLNTTAWVIQELKQFSSWFPEGGNPKWWSPRGLITPEVPPLCSTWHMKD